MPLVTGRLTDSSEQSISGLRPRVLFHLNHATLHGDTVIVGHPVEANLNGLLFSINLAPTAKNEFYTVEVRYLDPTGAASARPWSQIIHQHVEVTESGGPIGGQGGVWATPDTVTVSLTEPEDENEFWLQAAIGDPDPGTDTGPGDFYRRIS